jgi:hypothetical protein
MEGREWADFWTIMDRFLETSSISGLGLVGFWRWNGLLLVPFFFIKLLPFSQNESLSGWSLLTAHCGLHSPAARREHRLGQPH